VSKTLGKAQKTLGKNFVKWHTQQRSLGKKIVNTTLSSAAVGPWHTKKSVITASTPLMAGLPSVIDNTW
jgi:hypothetical protein